MLTAGSLRSPTGDLGDSLFPGESSGQLDSRLQGYLDDGYAKAGAAGVTDPDDQDEIAKAWAYYRAYNAVYIRMLNNPSTVTMERQGSASTLWSQIEAMGKLADAALANYRELLPADIGAGPPSLPETTAIQTQISY
jgi:hypothetical protein